MKALIGFELYKIFTQRSLYIAAFLLFLVTAFFSSQMVGPPRHDLYQKWEGPVTSADFHKAAKLDASLAEKQKNGEDIDPDVFQQRKVYFDVMGVHWYQKQQREVISQENQVLNQINNSSSYPYRAVKLKKDMMADIDYNELHYQLPAEQMTAFLDTYGFVILSVLILVGISPIFTEEASTGVYQQMLSSKNGRKTVVHAKLIAAFILVLATIIVSIAFDLIFWNIAYGNYGWNANIQSIFTFADSPYPYTLGTYFIIKVIFQLIAGSALAVFAALISSLSRNSIVSFFISGFLFGLPVIITQVMSMELPGWLETALNFTYSNGMMSDSLFQQFETVNFFGYPILLPWVVLIWFIIITGVLLAALYQTMKNKQVI